MGAVAGLFTAIVFVFTAVGSPAMAGSLKDIEDIKAELSEVEVDCWHKAVDDDGDFVCSFVVVTGLASMNDGQTKRMVPEAAAPDNGGPQTAEQATRLCRAMRFAFARSFEIQAINKPTDVLALDSSLVSGALSRESRGSFIQNLTCGL